MRGGVGAVNAVRGGVGAVNAVRGGVDAVNAFLTTGTTAPDLANYVFTTRAIQMIKRGSLRSKCLVRGVDAVNAL